MSRSAIQGQPLAEPSAEPIRAVANPDLAELYGQHFRYVWRCLRSLGVHDWELDDAIQDVFLVVQRKLPDFDGQVSPRTWLYAIAIRIARRCKERDQRGLRRNDSNDERLHGVPSQRDTEAEYHRNQQLLLARTALDALDDDKREVFVLAQVEQMSAPEISAVTGLPINTVYSRLRAARSAFALAIQRLEARDRRSP